jgi:steroid delta-isomerase-like uncharacterized protein
MDAHEAKGELQRNKEVAAHFAYQLSQKEIRAATKLLADDFVYNAPGFPPLKGAKEWQGLAESFAANSPKLNLKPEEQVAERDTVITRYTWSTVHEREFMGMPPTGKTLVVTSLALNRVKDGRITEHFVLDDYLGVFRQLGAIPLGFFQQQIDVPGVGHRPVPVGKEAIPA